MTVATLAGSLPASVRPASRAGAQCLGQALPAKAHPAGQGGGAAIALFEGC